MDPDQALQYVKSNLNHILSLLLFLHMQFLELFTRKESYENHENQGMLFFLNCIEIIVGNGTFTHFQQMIYFLQCIK